MPASGRPSEYGGKVQRNTFQPENPDTETPREFPPAGGHTLTASEQLGLVYSTGQDADPTLNRDPAAFEGNGPRDTWDELDERFPTAEESQRIHGNPDLQSGEGEGD